MAVAPANLEWKSVTVGIRGAQRKDVKKASGQTVPDVESTTGSGEYQGKLLNCVSGYAAAGTFTAIMGASGSGKSTLLNALAGTLPGGLDLYGSLSVNGANVPSLRVAYVRQEDAFFSELTVEETISFAARLRVKDLRGAEAEYSAVLNKLGLSRCRATRVGGGRGKRSGGCSGGERKRLQIACELLESPSIVLVDEPTTGLDSFQSQRVIEVLRSLADAGHTVVATIHQPRTASFALFDQLYLLSESELVYAGPASTAAAYFRENFPERYALRDGNPAEDIMDCVSVDYSSPEAEMITKATRGRLIALWKQKAKAIKQPEKRRVSFQEEVHVFNEGDKGENVSKKLKTSSRKVEGTCNPKRRWFFQFRQLLVRAWRQVKRDKATSTARLISAIGSAVVFGSIYWKLPRTRAGISSRQGLLQVAAINTAMSSITKTLATYPAERNIAKREKAQGFYSQSAYFASKLLAEIPFAALPPLLFASLLYPAAGLTRDLGRFGKFISVLTLESFAATSLGLLVGAMSSSTEVALAIGPSLMVVFIVFGGLYTNESTTPAFWRPISKVSMIRWGFQGLVINEFSGQTYGDQTEICGDALLENLNFNGGVKKSVKRLTTITAFNYLACYWVLSRSKSSEVRMQPPVRRNSSHSSPGSESAS